ncbi:MAG: S-layer homology domain-containing protein [Candidatus Gastranaerophilales bacterium]|nr:S-layer homology domain-containing protein [Candidatus Gastranaerophilales bacterium]
MYKKDFKKLILLMIIPLFFPNYASSLEFDDVPQGFWAYEQIDNLTNEKIINGYADNTFLPDKLVTRAEYAAMVIKTIGQENITIETMYSFEDIDSKHWAWNYVIRAVNLDIIKPVSDSYFYPDDYVTRSDVITFLVNILKSEDITKKEAITALQNAYEDFDDIPDWFKVTAGKAEVLNVIAKEPPREHYLDYDKYVTRAQMAVFLNNLKEKINSYLQEKIIEEKSPKKGEGIIIENVTAVDDVVTIPARTVLPVMVIGQISSGDALPGQMFNARFANNIVDYEHNILLSRDIVLVGKVLNSTKAVNFLRNGELMFELSAANKNNNFTRILGVAEYQAYISESNKVKKAAKQIIKGQDFTAKDGQILYIRLFKPMRVNIVTGEVLD